MILCTIYLKVTVCHCMSDKDISYFYVPWRKSIRLLFKLPYTTHCNLLPDICNDIPIEVQIHKRIVQFVSSLISSNNKCINLAYKLMVNGSSSTISNSVSFICQKYKLDSFSLNHLSISSLHTHDQHIKVVSSVIREMMDIRDNQSTCIITRDEATKWVNALCTR
jgi:hypothetical protein